MKIQQKNSKSSQSYSDLTKTFLDKKVKLFINGRTPLTKLRIIWMTTALELSVSILLRPMCWIHEMGQNMPEMNVSHLNTNPCESLLITLKNKKLVSFLLSPSALAKKNSWIHDFGTIKKNSCYMVQCIFFGVGWT